MSDRLPINTESLKARFPEVYREFFSKCAIVCSAPRSVSLIGEYVGYETFGMRQALPMRTYVGLTPRRADSLGVVQYITFDLEEGKFQERILDDDFKGHIEDRLSSLLRTVFPALTPRGFDVHILTELPLKRALGGAGSLFASLTVALFLSHAIIKKEHVFSWGNGTIRELISNPETKFDLTFRTIWKIETALYYIASGLSHFIALVPSAVPVVFTSKKGMDSAELMRRVRNSEEVDLNQLIDQSQYCGARSNELFGKHVGWPFPFDWGVISTEQFRMVRDVMFTTADVQEELHEVARDAIKIKEQLFGKSFTGASSYFFELCLPDHSSELWQYYIGSLVLLSFQAFLKFKKILERGPSKKYVSELFELMNKMHGIFYPLGLCSDKINTLVHRLRENIADKIGADAVAVRMNSTARRGNILFATTAPLARPFIEEFIETVGNEGNEKVSLDYASWIDGYEKEGGVKVEQFTEEGIYSPLLEGGSLRLVRWGKKGETSTTIIQPTDIKKEAFDILFDSVHEKLYVKGKECTSDDLPSQKTTVEILSLLMTTEGHRLHNKMLPQSSYASYRNELQGKIVGPLTALVEKRLKRELKLKIEGTLTDFWISLDPKGFSIGFVKKLQ